jgi:glycosyltransferase involved in cell wall biosynthesis
MARRILILNERDSENPLAGGAEVHLFESFGRLARRGHEVTLICASFPGCKRKETIDGIRVRRLVNRYFYYAAAPFAARRHIKRNGCDVVVDVLCKLPFLSPWFLPVPCVALIHHLFGTTAFSQVLFPVALATWASEKLIPYAYRNSLCIAVSPSTKEDLIERGLDPRSIAIVPCGLDHDLYSPGTGEKPSAPRIAWLGRAEPYKRVDLLLEAVAKITPGFPGLELWIVGDGGAIPDLRDTAARLGIENQTAFFGFVDEQEKVRKLRDAHVLVNTSEKEGWGLTVLEGNACGTPTIASDVPGLRDSVRPGETGLLIPHEDVDALADALTSVLRDTELRESLSRNGLAWAKNFTWDANMRDTERMLEAVIAGEPQQSIRPLESPFTD